MTQTAREKTLTHQQAKAFYDRLGRGQDWQGFYEDPPVRALIEHGAFEKAGAVLEFGCGTGRLAERLLDGAMAAGARYVGMDISDTMIRLAEARLSRFGDRARVQRTAGSPRLDFEAGRFDRFVSTYVLDLLSAEDIRTVLQEAHRVLADGGLLCLASLTHGFTVPSRLLERAWMALYGLRPSLVGGCRPLGLPALLDDARWRIRFQEKYSRWGVPTEALIAEKR
ncbi:MAG TPA: class I SAM-dependent methyltransferase [Gammaproteobacteria bacterium]|nr:class I SAM-dependent methyltransferase [Gammaproteobacteria bacterium]